MNFKLLNIIVLTCSDLIEIRENHFTAQSLSELFQDISPEKIFNFFKEINIFERSLLVMFVSYSPFKYGFNIVQVPVLTRIKSNI